MSRTILPKLLCLLLIIAPLTWALEDMESFPDPALGLRFQQLVQDLRCPKCQNQNLADSNSMIAKDLRAEVRRLLIEGKTDRQIEDHLIVRYGEFVLYKPRLNPATQLLWFTPVLLLLLGIFILLRLVIKQRKVQQVKPLDAAEQQRLKQLLGQKNQEPRQ